MSGYDSSDDVSMFDHMILERPSAADPISILADDPNISPDFAKALRMLKGPCICVEQGINKYRTDRCTLCCGKGFIVEEQA